ncbi:glycosyl hydrolase family 8 [Oryzifoliimicrobium ureilyticus]|uniref:glycosyl hydrolase family 8 n=1 Tax=Oryzifoliimicrobium ureilyticus TaxID=3113724 RepID=UPI00307613AF
MRIWSCFGLLFAAITLICLPQTAGAAGSVDPQFWAAYKEKFLDPSGRIIDNGNGNISHSEGQGYGLLLAYLADSPSDFEQIWYFTRTELLLRDDGLAVWKWDPSETPHVKDSNNATDGDLLIAYALALAGSSWSRNDYLAVAQKMAKSILSETVVTVGGRTLLLPGTQGFTSSDRKDGPVVNLSYWIYEALPVMKALAPSDSWDKLAADGLDLTDDAQFGPRKLPPEWLSVVRVPAPATGFDVEFGYNAIRIPLYLIRGGVTDAALLERLRTAMIAGDGTPAIFDLMSGKVKEPLPDPGYQIVGDLLACVLHKTKLSDSVRRFAPAYYYPSTLQLLGLSYAMERHPECL